jgi:hypothetical protein
MAASSSSTCTLRGDLEEGDDTLADLDILMPVPKDSTCLQNSWP